MGRNGIIGIGTNTPMPWESMSEEGLQDEDADGTAY